MIREGREKPNWPKAKRKSQRLTRGTSNGHNFRLLSSDFHKIGLFGTSKMYSPCS
ncbi:hypothetical protein KI387_017773, partial [Taxus chinensis]